MKKRLTFLTTLALLVFMAPSITAWGQAPVNTTLWEETWTGGAAGTTPSAYDFSGTTVYGDATLTYAQSSTATKLYAEELAGGTTPELLLSKSNQTWTISNIPTGQATGMSLTFLSNKTTFTVSTTTEGISVSGSQKSWTINVTGNVTNFDLTIKNTGSSNARIDNIKLTVTTAGAGASTVATPFITPNGGSFLDSQEVSLSCATEGATIYYTTNGNNPTTSSTVYSAPFTIDATTTVKAFAVKSGMSNSAIASATFTKIIPMTVAEARAAIDAGTGTQDVYVTGIVSGIVDAWSTQYSNISFNMSDDGLTSSDQLEAFRCVSTDNANASEVGAGDVVVVHGNLTLYNSTVYEIASGCQLISLEHPAVAVEVPTFSPAEGIYEETQNVTISCATSGATIYYTTDGSDPTSSSTQYTAPISIATTTTVKAIAVKGSDTSTMATATYTIVSLANISSITTVNDAYMVRGTVVAINNRGYVIGDGTGYVYVYLNATPSVNIDDMVTVMGTTGSYGHIIQFTSSATVTAASASNYNNTPTATLITEVPDYTTGYHLSDYLEFEGYMAKVNGNYIIQIGEGDDEVIQVSYPNSEQIALLDALSSKTVHMKGYFTGINSTDKFTVMVGSIEEVVSTTPTINASNITLDWDATEGSIPYTITNPVTGTTLSATTTAEWIENLNVTDEAITFNTDPNNGTEDRTATITLSYTGATNVTVTVTQGHYVVDYAELPFAFNGGRADIANTDGLTHEGLGTDYSTTNTKLKFDGTGDWLLLHFNGTPSILTFDIKGNSFSDGTFTVQASEDGTTYTDVDTYTELGDAETKTIDNLGENVRYIKWIYTEKGNGNVGLGNIILTTPITGLLIELSETTVSVPAAGESGSIMVDYHNFTDVEPYIEFFAADGTTSATYDWISVNIDEDNNVAYSVDANDGEARTAYFKVFEANEGVYSELVTVNQAEYVIDYATLPFEFNGGKADIANTLGLTHEGLGSDYAASTNPTTLLKFDGTGDWLILHLNEAPTSLSYDIKGNSFSGSTFTVQTSANGTDYDELVSYTELSGPAMSVTFLDLNSDVRYIKWIYTNKSSGNVGLGNIHASADYDIYGEITVETFNIPEDKTCTIYNKGMLNVTASLTNEATTNAWEHLIIKDGGQLKTPNTVDGTAEKEITGWSSYTGTGNGGYCLLATPATMDACNNTGMWNQSTVENIDFYSFDQSYENAEWRNYKDGNPTLAGPIPIMQGKGYLYANMNDVTLTFETRGFIAPPNFVYEAHPFVATNANQNVAVSYTAGKPFSGFNLIGNPFTCKAYLADGRDFYRMNTAGDAITLATDNAINVCEGIFVVTTSTESSVTFTTTAPTGGRSLIELAVSQGARSDVLNAVRIRFGEGQMLPSFNFNPNSTRLFISRGDKDYTVVYREEEEGELPVSFKAETNGSYTISLNSENVEFDYLHLIDNMTGNDVDLLATPSYTFDAQTTDNAARFKVVFSKTTTGVSEHFAYVNNGNIIVNGEGTLQVIDLLGRVIKNVELSSQNVSTEDLTPGVYMLRLVNDNDAKTQKIVVK